MQFSADILNSSDMVATAAPSENTGVIVASIDSCQAAKQMLGRPLYTLIMPHCYQAQNVTVLVVGQLLQKLIFCLEITAADGSVDNGVDLACCRF